MDMQLPDKIRIVSEKDNQAKFEITPLYPGYGITVGNSLRRALLSSLEGASISSIKLASVGHEFSSIPGVLEDIIDIIVNLKRVRIKLFDGDSVTATLKIKGEKKVLASDIKLPSDVEIVNPDQHIATLTDKNGELDMELTIEKGIGYITVDHKNKDKLNVGQITIDSIFSPVEFVNFEIENIRVGERTDYNKIIIDIRTDGTISPREALDKASQILIDHFKIIKNDDSKETKTKSESIDIDNQEVIPVEKTPEEDNEEQIT